MRKKGDISKKYFNLKDEIMNVFGEDILTIRQVFLKLRVAHKKISWVTTKRYIFELKKEQKLIQIPTQTQLTLWKSAITSK